VAQAAKTDWQQLEDRDPTLDRMNLGFTVAAVFLAAWWNLQPQRFHAILVEAALQITHRHAIQIVFRSESHRSNLAPR